MPLPAYLGNVSAKEQPGSPEIVYRAGQDSMIRTYRGLYLDLYNNKPDEGTTMPDLDPQWVVDEVRIRADRGIRGQGSLVITLTNWATMDAEYDLDYVDLTRALELHPRWAVGAGGAKELTATDLTQLERWKREPDWNLRLAFQYLNRMTAIDGSVTYETITLSTNAQDLAAKVLKGADGYNDSYPIVTATTFHRTNPNIDRPWTPQDPPSAANPPDDYEWLYGTPKKIKRRWYIELREKWIGAEEWDSEIYPT